MAHNVYANNHEIASKAASGTSVIPVGDVCWTPPTAPPTPLGVPIPYPNSCSATDITNGTRTVMIMGKMVAMEDKSYFSTSTGDEGATETLQKGLISHKIKGKCYFAAWSQNVKVEGAGVPRNLDMVTHNHGSPANIPLVPYVSIATMPVQCGKEQDAISENCKPDPKKDPPSKLWVQDHCDGLQDKPKTAADANALTAKADTNPCVQARRCKVVPYENTDKKKAQNGNGCCPGQTGHHLMPDAMFRMEAPGIKDRFKKPTISGWGGYDGKKAPTVCMEGKTNAFDWGSHGNMHKRAHDALNKTARDQPISYEDARLKMATTLTERCPKCSVECTMAQLDEFFGQAAKDDDGKPKKLKDSVVNVHDGTNANKADDLNLGGR